MRRGFTLLEMILALLIGVVVLSCFYSVLSYQVKSSQSGRIMTQEARLAQGILTKMTRDILGTLGPDNPMYLFGMTPPVVPYVTPPTPTTTNLTFVFNNGVYGDPTHLVLCVTKVPGKFNTTGAVGTIDPTLQATVCDQRRVSYWMESTGLAYQEVQQPTSNDTTISPPSLSDTGSTIIAPEVKDIAFQFYDGTNWQDTWDGTTLGGPNDNLPVGPPSAIRITLTLFRKGPDNADLPDDQLPKFVQEVAIPTGNNFPQTSQ